MARDSCVTIAGYGRSTRLAPRWYVGYLTFRGGNPDLPRDSLTGGGVIPPRGFAGTFQPIVKNYRSPVLDFTGSGTLPSDEPGLTALLRPVRGPAGSGNL